MKTWWRELGLRQSMALWLYGLVLLLLVGSLFMVFWVHVDYEIVASTPEVIVQVVKLGVSDPDYFRADSWEEFVRGPINALSFALSHLLVLPGGYFLILATRSGVFAWSGRLIWSLLFLIGPVVMMLGDEAVYMSTGFWAWSAWVLLMAGAHFVVTPLRATPPGSLPSPESGPSG